MRSNLQAAEVRRRQDEDDLGDCDLPEILGTPQAAAETGAGDSTEQGPARRSSKWLEEIETDVLRTCPADAVEEFDGAIFRNSAADVTSSSSREETGIGYSGIGGIVTEDSRAGNGSNAISGADDFGTGTTPSLLTTGTEEGTLSEDVATAAAAVATEGVNGGTTVSATGGGMRNKLRRVLRAFAVYNRRVSYCQVGVGWEG